MKRRPTYTSHDVEFTLAKLQQQVDRIPTPRARRGAVLGIRLQILRNSIRVAPGLTASARAVLLEQVDELAANLEALKGGA
jgi:hypothetical protein